MSRRKPAVGPFTHLYLYEDSYTMEGGRVIAHGEIIKIHGVNATKFRFKNYTKRLDTGVEWISCFELQRNQNGIERSFRPDRIKPLPKKRGPRKKKVHEN